MVYRKTHTFLFAAWSFVLIVQEILLCPATWAATAHLIPNSSPPLSTIQMAGSGFTPHELLDLFFNTVDLDTVTADASGAFAEAPLRIPAAAVPGRHWITVKGRSSGRVAQIAVLVRSDWRQFHADPQHTGANPAENVLNPTNVHALELHWRYKTDGSISSSPVVANGVVYVGSFDGSLYALNASNGILKWRRPIPEGTTKAPVVMYGRVYVASWDSEAGRLFVFNAKTGEPLWNLGTTNAGGFNNAPVLADNVGYILSDGGGLFAFRATTGKQIWGRLLPGVGSSSTPAIAHGRVYAPGSYRLFAVDRQTGRLLWERYAGYLAQNIPAIGSGNIYIGNDDSELYAFDAQTGVQRWRAYTGDSIYSSPAVANGMVYVGADDGYLYAFNAQTGRLAWNTRVSPGTFSSWSIRSSPAIANGIVYVGYYARFVFRGGLAAFDAQTGNRLWSTESLPEQPRTVHSSPAVANGMVYVGSGDNYLYAYALPAHLLPRPPRRPNPNVLVPSP